MELQGHGRSPDTDRPITFAGMSDDVARSLERNGHRHIGYDQPSAAELNLPIRRRHVCSHSGAGGIGVGSEKSFNNHSEA